MNSISTVLLLCLCFLKGCSHSKSVLNFFLPENSIDLHVSFFLNVIISKMAVEDTEF